MFKLEDIYEAYYDCRRHKRATASCIEFEIDFDTHCIELWRELNDRTYRVSASIAFVVTKPRLREIFAASFRDRIVHHLIDVKLRPLIEEELVERTYNNRIGKGTAACIAQLKVDIIEVSEGYTKDCWIMKQDMKGFFMSLSKSTLVRMVHKFIDERYHGDDKEDLKWLIEVVLKDSPEENCFLKSPLSLWDELDPAKSLFTIPSDLGLPIGNLISQLMANFYLNEFDHFVIEGLGFGRYGRYVDDFYIVSNDKQKMLHSVPLMREKLLEVGVTLHPDKFYFQHYMKGVEMLGAIIKPQRTYLHNRTVNNAFEKIKVLIREPRVGTEGDVAVVNSYLGLMSAHSTFKTRRRLINEVLKLEGIYAQANLKKVMLRNNLKDDYLITKKLKQYEKANKRNVRSN